MYRYNYAFLCVNDMKTIFLLAMQVFKSNLSVINAGILKDKTMDDGLTHIPIMDFFIYTTLLHATE